MPATSPHSARWSLLFVALGACASLGAKRPAPNPSSDPNDPTIGIKISDPSGDAWHIHAKSGFPVTVNVSGGVAPTSLMYQWRDYTGKALTEWAALPKTAITAPANRLAFFDLVLKCTDPRYHLPLRQPGEIREYGFMVFPQKKESQRVRNDASHMGVNQLAFNENDGVNFRACPYFSGWCKSMEWNHNYSGKWVWKTYIQERLNVGLKELPLAVGGSWGKIDNSKLATEEELKQIYDQAHDRLSQEKACNDPLGTYTYHWELGLEESSAISDKKASHYLENLRAKSDQFRKAAADLGIENLNLVWQDVEWDGSATAEKFLASKAASNFGTLALHPYPWVNGTQDFIDPETWMPKLMGGIKTAMQANHQVKPVWFTEVGAPVQYNFPTPEFGGSFETNQFGYPDGKGGYKKNGWPVYDNGIARSHIGPYLAKVYAMALHEGVERLFWYNYKDNGKDPYYAEQTFGLFDVDQFPKPSFATYCIVDSFLGGRSSNTTADGSKVTQHIDGKLYVYDFPGKNVTSPHILVVWTSDGSHQSPALSALSPTLTSKTLVQVRDVVGSPQPLPTDETLTVGGDPIFIEMKVPPPPPQKVTPGMLRPALPVPTAN